MSVEDIKSGLADKIESDGGLDYIQLIEQSGTLGRIASIVTGILVTVILILVPLVSACEIIYIAFPVFREKVDKLLVKIEDKGVVHKVIGFTLRDAIEAVEQANTEYIGEKSAMLIYLQLKLKSLEFMMFIIAIVLAGSSTIVSVVWNAIQGILNSLPI